MNERNKIINAAAELERLGLNAEQLKVLRDLVNASLEVCNQLDDTKINKVVEEKVESVKPSLPNDVIL